MGQPTRRNKFSWFWLLFLLLASIPALTMAQEADEISDVPLAYKHSLSLEASLVGVLGEAYDAFEGLGFDLELQCNIRRFSIGIAFQYRSQLPVGEMHSDGIEHENVFGLSPDLRYSLPLRSRMGLYLGLQPGVVVGGVIIAASVGATFGVYVSFTDWLAVHAGIGGTVWIAEEVYGMGTANIGLALSWNFLNRRPASR